MRWVLDVLLHSFCAFKCGLKHMGEPLMHVFDAHISSPADQWADKETKIQKQVETLHQRLTEKALLKFFDGLP